MGRGLTVRIAREPKNGTRPFDHEVVLELRPQCQTIAGRPLRHHGLAVLEDDGKMRTSLVAVPAAGDRIEFLRSGLPLVLKRKSSDVTAVVRFGRNRLTGIVHFENKPL